MARPMRTHERGDAELVAAALSGDRQAVADIYDRYGTVVYTVCVRLLGNRDDAADCAAEVFLRATERLHQLREPEKLKPWLYAIARNEVARRQRRRSREVPVESIDELPWLPGGDDDLAVVVSGTTASTASAGAEAVGAGSSGFAGSPGAIEALIQEASAGLTDRDRAVAELGLRQRLQGDELADALGVTTNHAYVLVHRVRGRLERAITAILVARSGRDDCTELQTILRGWDGELTVLLRKRVARHIDRCEICGSKRKLVPAALFDAAPVLAAPIAIRHRVLAEAQVATDTGRPWSSDGFPRGRGGGRRTLWLSAAAVVLVLLLVAGLAAGTGGDEVVMAERPSGGLPSAAGTSPPSTAPGSSQPAGTTVETPDPNLDAAAAAAAAATSTTVADGGAAPTTTVAGGSPGGGGDPGGGDPDPPPAAGSLVASPAAIDFGAASSGQGLVLSNTGGTALSFTLGSSASQVSLSPASGSVEPGAAVVISVTLDRGDLPDQFAAAISGDAGGAGLVIPVTATNAQAPVIVSADGPQQFGSVASANPGCDVVVEATDNGSITEVRVVFDGPNDYEAALPAVGPGTWRGQLLVGAAAPMTGFWHVVVRDAAGNETASSPVLATTGSICLP